MFSSFMYAFIALKISFKLCGGLADSKKAPDVIDISNQSSKEGIRIVIELRKDANVDNFINLLYKKTKLEEI